MSFYSPKSWVKEIAHVQFLTRLNQKHNSSARNAPLSGCCFNKANIRPLGPQVWKSQDIIAERDGFNQILAGNRICIRRKWRDFNEGTTHRGVRKAKGLEHPGTCNSWESLPLLIAQESSAVRGRCPAGAVSMKGHSPAINTSYSLGGVGKKCQNPLSSSDPHWYPTQQEAGRQGSLGDVVHGGHGAWQERAETGFEVGETNGGKVPQKSVLCAETVPGQVPGGQCG